MMRSMGADEGHARAVMDAADIRKDGVISFEEFCAAVGPIYEHSELALRRAFDLFDRDGNGSIDRQELANVMTRLRLLPGDAGPEAIEEIFALADINKDGQISFAEFVRLFSPEPSRALR